MSGCSPACSSASLAQIHDPAGTTFTVTRTDCDTIAKDSAILITAARDNERDSTLLLKYEPWADELPQVYVAEGGAIVIHVAKASSISEQHPTWGALKVNITIDELAYPDRGPFMQSRLEANAEGFRSRDPSRAPEIRNAGFSRDAGAGEDNGSRRTGKNAREAGDRRHGGILAHHF